MVDPRGRRRGDRGLLQDPGDEDREDRFDRVMRTVWIVIAAGVAAALVVALLTGRTVGVPVPGT